MPRIVLLALLALCAWNAYLDRRLDREQETGYSEAEIRGLDTLIASTACDDWLCQLSEKRGIR